MAPEMIQPPLIFLIFQAEQSMVQQDKLSIERQLQINEIKQKLREKLSEINNQ